MVGWLKGILLMKQPPLLLINVNGVGYEVVVSMNTLYRLPDEGQVVSLYTHLIIREDAHTLYGFYDLEERMMFRELLRVNGVGPKIALAILSNMDPQSFVQNVLSNETSALMHIPGIGKKTAERLIIEMRDRLNKLEFARPLMQEGSSQQQGQSYHRSPAIQDAMSALEVLGYKPQEANEVVVKIAQEGLSSADLIRLALQYLGK
jgi:holliday junction DNA helicase RuvA